MQSAVSLERLLSIVLALGEDRPLSAPQLASRLGVSLRTVYRDVRRLQAAGIPVASANGRAGGLLLARGFRLAPLAFTPREMTAIALAIGTLRSMPTLPYRAELDSATRKIAGAARVGRPELLSQLERWLRVEPPAADAFHGELPAAAAESSRTAQVVQEFIDALLAGRSVTITYHSPYSKPAPPQRVDPAGVMVDRGLWYLVAYGTGKLRSERHFRADRATAIELAGPIAVARVPDWRGAGERPWLRRAMRTWLAEDPVELLVSREQASRLSRDWYFSSGAFTPAGKDRVRFAWGEDNFERVRELVAWLGPPARLVAPTHWIPRLREALAAQASAHSAP